ncbi:replicative DNA helicase [Paractinoplanes deccanensis]|uniref:DNA 5'-3' helicase n=1 Tax=Paractinoplanes deccanensis TaxID=113561 RepID=A0ABQ3XZY6_9ACTN|nr:replicative DNA helicase [Actinoplanes deccanensis]GID73300.1 replicative DNA helicase [Actinoplanes deccanensis]
MSSDTGTGLDRAPMFDLAYERIVIGAMMDNPAVIDMVATKVTAEDFYSHRHASVFTEICNAHADGQITEPHAMTARLLDAGTLGQLGGIDFLHQCYAEVPVAVQAGHYADRIAELAERRAWEAKGVQIVQAANQPAGRDLGALAEKLLTEVKPRGQSNDMVQLGALIQPAVADIKLRRHVPAGLPTGFADLDALLGGLRKKNLITVAAPTGAGKSIFLTDLARNLALRNSLVVAYFSLEMSNEEVFERILSAEAEIPAHLVRDGLVSEEKWAEASTVIGPMASAPLFMCDETDITVQQIKVRCQILQRRVGLDAVIVDYTQLVTPSRKFSSEQEGISDVSKSLKKMAGSLDVPVIAAAQMNKGPDLRADKYPQLTDLRGSGSIANDSNIVIFVHRPDYYDPESPRSGEADLVVRKARNAAKDAVTVAAQLHYSRFADMRAI